MVDYGDYPRAFLENGNSRVIEASLDADGVTAKAVFKSNIDTQLKTIINLATESGAESLLKLREK